MGSSNDKVEQLSALLLEKDGEIARLSVTVDALTARVAELEELLGRNSKNSSLPPSTDGFAKAPVPANRAARRRRPGKQTGDPGHRLEPVEHPDYVVTHSPCFCASCDRDLARSEVIKCETRQVFELPQMRAIVTEHQVETRRCVCGELTAGQFPPEAVGPTCYGPGVRALLTYLVVAQHLPIERATEVLKECCAITVSSGFATSLIGEAGESLAEFVEATRAALRKSPVLHLDETGARVAGRLGWVHSASNAQLTAYLFHENVTHQLCNAHHLRDLRAAAEDGQLWAHELHPASRDQRPREDGPGEGVTRSFNAHPQCPHSPLRPPDYRGLRRERATATNGPGGSTETDQVREPSSPPRSLPRRRAEIRHGLQRSLFEQPS